MSILFTKLLHAYEKRGYTIRGGLNPYYFDDPDVPFMSLYQGDTPISTGAGLAPIEILILEQLLESLFQVKNILIVGNAFGWSTLAIAMSCPNARVIALDARIEGNEVNIGDELTASIAEEEGLDVTVIQALSPRDVPSVMQSHFNNEALDFVLIDGLHVNEQLIRDYMVLSKYASDKCVFVFHDVLSWHMLSALETIASECACLAKVLTRSPSGMSVLYRNIDSNTETIIKSYVDKTINIDDWILANGGNKKYPGAKLINRISKGYSHGWHGLATVYAVEENWDFVNKVIREKLENQPNDPELLFEVGAFYIDRQKWFEADKYFAEAQYLSPGWAQPPHQRGRVYKNLDNFDLALVFFKKATELDPSWYPAHFEIAVLESQRSNLKSVLDHFIHIEALICDLPDRAKIFFDMGALLYDQQQWETADYFYTKAQEGLSCIPEVHHQKALVNIQLNNFEEAKLNFKKAIEINKNWFPSYIELASLHMRMGLFSDALKIYKEMQQLFPDHIIPWEDFAHKLPNDANALNELYQLCQQEPMWGGVRKALGIVMRKTGLLQEAITVFENGCKYIPNWPGAGVLYEIGLVYLQMGDYQAAQLSFKEALERRPNFIEAMEKLQDVSLFFQ